MAILKNLLYERMINMKMFFDKTRTTRFSVKGKILEITGITKEIETKYFNLNKLSTGEYLCSIPVYGNWSYMAEQLRLIQERIDDLIANNPKYTEDSFSVGTEMFFDTVRFSLTNSETAEKTENDDALKSLSDFLFSFEHESRLDRKPYRWSDLELKVALDCMKASQHKDHISEKELYETINDGEIQKRRNFYGPGKFIIYSSYQYDTEIRRIFRNKRICKDYVIEDFDSRLDASLKSNSQIREEDEAKYAFLLLSPKASTALEILRREQGLTRKGLSEESGIKIKTIEQYEQKVRNIQHAPFVFVYKLAKTLGCNMEDIVD